MTGDMSRTERIVEYQKRMGDMRQVYLKLKAELAYLDKKKKKETAQAWVAGIEWGCMALNLLFF